MLSFYLLLLCILASVVHFKKLYPWHLILHFIQSVERPFLLHIYRNGPNFRLLQMEFGFWSGRQLVDICAQLTGQSAEFWLRNMNECQSLFAQKEESFVVLIEITVGVILAFKLMRMGFLLLAYFCCPSTRPLFRLM